MSRHRLVSVRPRYGRIAAAGAAGVVTVVAVVGGLGLVTFSSPSDAGEAHSHLADRLVPKPASGGDVPPTGDGSVVRAGPSADRAGAREPAPLPDDSGTGRRVVFSESEQRVWLVAPGDVVRRTYLVSGSLHDNLAPGTYAVYSRSEQAWGIDDSGTMRWFVRFTQGPNAAIGFHSIPELAGEPVQTRAELGTPRSHGCIRQRMVDAEALWDFAPVGTTVVVTA
jgi:hypothetical protein